MSIHIKLARAMIRLGAALQALAVMVLPADDLVEISRQTYAKPNSIEGWSSDDVLNPGLYPREQHLLELLPKKQGRMLLLGVGGGREAVPFARLGYEVTGLDFVPALVERAIANAASQGLRIDGLVQNIAQLDLAANTYDVVWLSAAMYSCVPTRTRRVEMLRRIHGTLTPGGYFACQFHWDPRQLPSSRGRRWRKALAWLSFGNLTYEPGDMLWANIEFIHAFSSAEDLTTEFRQGGFEVIWLHIPQDGSLRGEALLRKPQS